MDRRVQRSCSKICWSQCLLQFVFVNWDTVFVCHYTCVLTGTAASRYGNERGLFMWHTIRGKSNVLTTYDVMPKISVECHCIWETSYATSWTNASGSMLCLSRDIYQENGSADQRATSCAFFTLSVLLMDYVRDEQAHAFGR
ncbi:hypothetical protein PsorP6_000092 [Peronosclerospora sorghi]|uniref:Uncharacterized protein n=1 Tax=Peronosclerospora sorghi TaxID=230839 RepID=A0ACC0WX00_9STRA|nr:hypothetical protein PsorP6_000092 [Peronosclerospora sorghi]